MCSWAKLQEQVNNLPATVGCGSVGSIMLGPAPFFRIRIFLLVINGHSFTRAMEIDFEIFSMVIVSLPLG